LESVTDRLGVSGIPEALPGPFVLAGLLALIAVVIGIPVAMLRRNPSIRYGATAPIPLTPAVATESDRLRADRSERGLVMRFGSRRDDDGRAASPASRSVAEVAQQPVLPSKRLQRVAEHFRAQGELLATM